MKNMFKLSGIIFIVMMIGLLAVGCENPSGGGKKDDGTPETSFSVEGQFSKQGGGNVKFSLSDAKNYSRAADADSFAVSGELQDGDITFRLTGTYDPVALKYTASAAASMIRYSIDGAFDEDGDSLGTTATLLVNNGSDNWVAYSYVVQETAVNITGRESTDVASGGVPSFARGYWNFNLFDLAGATALLSQWSISVESVYQDDDGKNVYENFKRPIIEVSGSGSNYNAIYSFPLYQGTKAQVEAAAAAFLRSKGLSARKLDESPDLPTDRLYYYFKIESGYLDFGTYQGNFSLDRDVNNAILNDLYATIATENDGSLTESEATTILAQVLSNHGVNISTIEKLTVPLNKPALPEGPFYYYDAQWNDISWNYGWKQSESNNSNEAKSDAFYNATDSWWETSYLEKYLISKGVAPTTRYGKMQIKFSNNNTKMTTRNYVSGSGSSMEWDWATLAAARSVNSFDPNEEPITLSR